MKIYILLSNNMKLSLVFDVEIKKRSAGRKINNLGRNTDHVGSEADKGEIYLQDYTGKDRIRSVYVAFARYMFPKFLKKKKKKHRT